MQSNLPLMGLLKENTKKNWRLEGEKKPAAEIMVNKERFIEADVICL